MSQDIEIRKERRLALLIDGDNAQAALINKMMAEAGKYGLLTIRRNYGDWTTPNMNSWKETLNNHAIQPIQQFRYTVGKNATDSAMIIDAMDILHSNLVDGFCIVSSDSDYTRLATRIREEGLFVMGVGKRHTPKPFVNACNVFIYTENLETFKTKTKPAKTKVKAVDSANSNNTPEDLTSLLQEAFDMSVQEDGWAHLATLGSNLYQLDPGFDPRTYGYKQLSSLIKSNTDLFEIRFENYRGRTIVFVTIKDQ